MTWCQRLILWTLNSLPWSVWITGLTIRYLRISWCENAVDVIAMRLFVAQNTTKSFSIIIPDTFQGLISFPITLFLPSCLSSTLAFHAVTHYYQNVMLWYTVCDFLQLVVEIFGFLFCIIGWLHMPVWCCLDILRVIKVVVSQWTWKINYERVLRGTVH